MIDREDLLREIEECQRDPVTLAKIERLSCMLVVYDHLYGKTPYSRRETLPEAIVNIEGDSEFIQRIRGKKAVDVWRVMDELMAVLRVINERLYDQVLQNIYK